MQMGGVQFVPFVEVFFSVDSVKCSFKNFRDVADAVKSRNLGC